MNKIIVAIIVSVLATFGCHSEAGTVPTTDAGVSEVKVSDPEPAKTSEKPSVPQWITNLEGASSLNEAVEIVKNGSGFDQSSTGKRNSGSEALRLFFFDSHPLVWKDVSVRENETSFGKIKKNYSKEIGKRLCVSGTIVQIEEAGNSSYGLLSSNGNLFRYTNYGTSGDLTSGDYARMCGVSLGLYSYNNSGGGTGHAVEVAGVWDLSENKK